uniref:C2H2-type domain-containing protein n=1 Tax=Strongyloides stercoralis TaxID=6248 RepID=A0A0K0EM78_STRER
MDERIIVNTVLHFLQKYKTMNDIENIIYDGFSTDVINEAVEQLNLFLKDYGFSNEIEKISLLELYNKLNTYCTENNISVPKFVIDDIESVPKNLYAKLTCETKLDVITDEIRCLRKTMEEIRQRSQQGEKRVSPRRKKRRLSAELRSQKNGTSIADDCSSSSGDLQLSGHNSFCSSSSSSTSIIGSVSSPSSCITNDIGNGNQNLNTYLSNHSTPTSNSVTKKDSSRRTGGKLANCVQRLTDRLGSQKESVSPNDIETSDSPSSEVDNGISSSPATTGILFDNFLNQGIPLYTALNPNFFGKKIHPQIGNSFPIDSSINGTSGPGMEYLSLLISNAARNFTSQNKQFPMTVPTTVSDDLISSSQKLNINEKESSVKMEIDNCDTEKLWTDINPALSNGNIIDFGGNQEENKSDSDKPFVCEQENCNKRFANKFLLKKHQFIHTGLRPHACPYCQKRFNRKDNLLRHKKTHTQAGMSIDESKRCGFLINNETAGDLLENTLMNEASDDSNSHPSFLSKLWQKSRERCSIIQLEQYVNDDGSITKQGWELMHKSTSNSKRLKVISDMTSIIRDKRLQVSTLEGIWHTTNDMLDDDYTYNGYIKFLIEMTFSQNETLGIGLRHSFFLAIREIGINDLTIEWLGALLNNAKSLEPFEKDIGPLLADWMTKEYKIKSNDKRLIALMDIVGRLVRENSAHLKIEQLIRIISICQSVIKKNKKLVMPFAISVLTSVVKFYALPDEIVPDFVYMLCIIINNDETYEDAWKLARLALTSINSYVVVKYLEDLINKSRYMSMNDSKEKLSAIKGAAIILSNATWGHKFINAHVRITLSSILESFSYAIKLGPFVGVTIIQTVMRLVEKYFFTLNIITWNSICSVLLTSLEYCNENSDYGKVFEDTVHIIEFIASIYGKKQNGKCILVSPNFFNVVELLLKKKSNVNLTIGLIDYRIKLITPTDNDWINSCKNLFDRFFNQTNNVEVRLKIIDLLTYIFDKYGLLYESEIVECLILPYGELIYEEKCIDVKLKLLNVIFNIAEKVEINNIISMDSDLFSNLFHIISNVLKEPFKKLFELDYEKTILPRINELLYKRWNSMNLLIVNKIINVLNEHLYSYYNDEDYIDKKGNSCRSIIFELLLSIMPNFNTGEVELHYNIDDTEKLITNSFILVEDDDENNFHWDDICNSIIRALKVERSWIVLKSILIKLPSLLLNETMIKNLSCEIRNVLIQIILEYSNVNVEKQFNVTEYTFGMYYCNVISSLIIYENHENIYRISMKYLRLGVPNALKALNSLAYNNLLFFIPHISEILFEIRSMRNISNDFIFFILEFLYDSSSIAEYKKFQSKKKLNILFDILFIFINNSKNRIIITLSLHIIMKWYLLFDSESKKYFFKYFEEKCENLKCIIEDDINVLDNYTDISENVKSLLKSFFTYWLDLSEKYDEINDEEVTNCLSKGLKIKNSKHFIVNNTIITLNVLTKSRTIPNIENIKNIENKLQELNITDSMTEKSSTQNILSAIMNRSLQFDFEDLDVTSSECNKKTIEKETIKVEKSISGVFNNSIQIFEEPTTEYSQIIIRHICGKQMWILKSYDGVTTDFMSEINRKYPDHISLVRHLYEIHSTNKINGTEKINTFLNNFDKIKVKEEANISVVYIGNGLMNLTTILSNVYGSYRFNRFFKNLGILCRLSNQSNKNKDNVGEYYAYQSIDNTSILTFFISTIIPNNDNEFEYSFKKNIIGNNNIVIVFNESGKSYKLGTINNQVECVAIEIIPQNSKCVLVNTIVKKSLTHIITPIKEYLTDEKAVILVKNLCIRLSLCIKIIESIESSRNCDDIFMGQGMERFKKIEKFKRLAIMKEKY